MEDKEEQEIEASLPPSWLYVLYLRLKHFSF